MAQLRTVADLKDQVLLKCGELTNGNSDYDSDALNYLNEVYHALLSGANEFDVDAGEPWIWAKAEKPLLITLLAPFETGTVTLTNGAKTVTFSTAPTFDCYNCYLKVDGYSEYYQIKYQSSTSATIDMDWLGTTGSHNFKVIKLDYDLEDDIIVITGSNNKLDFTDSTGSAKVATLTQGVYTTSTLATEIDTQMTTASGTDSYTVSFDSVTRKFAIEQGSSPFGLSFGSGANYTQSVAKTLGYDSKNYSGESSYEATIPLNGILRLMAPMVAYKDGELATLSAEDSGKIFGIEHNTMLKQFPLTYLTQSMPTNFAIVGESDNGTLTVRFNSYPGEDTRVEVPYIAQQPDLQDTEASVPLVPRSYRTYLVYAASFFIMLDKSDSKADTFANLAKSKLRALVEYSRKDNKLSGHWYGRLIPRGGATKRNNTYRSN
jgi:hypothetical protein